jgi:hypothetical protein
MESRSAPLRGEPSENATVSFRKRYTTAAKKLIRKELGWAAQNLLG